MKNEQREHYLAIINGLILFIAYGSYDVHFEDDFVFAGDYADVSKEHENLLLFLGWEYHLERGQWYITAMP